MKPGVSVSERIGMSMGVAELDEPGRLVRGVGVDRAAEMHGVVGDHAERMALDADQAR